MMTDRRVIVGFGLNLIVLSLPLGAATCESLASFKLAKAAITAAQIVPAGAFLPPGPAPNAVALSTFKSLPAFCRVQGVIEPSSDSHIEFEVWLPAASWNRKYMGTGNGGLAGSIRYMYGPTRPEVSNDPGLAEAVLAGYAASSTDTGHKSVDAQWALGHPEKIVDFGYRAIHETAEKSRAIIRAFYGSGPQHSYFSSCAGGGRQGLIEAQRFPTDYDGIIAGAPVYSPTHFFAGGAVNMQATEADPASYIPAAKLPGIEAAALAACDALDGLKDGLIDDPRKCHFDPVTLLCRGAESDRCLTQPQVAALRKLYTGARTSKGEQIWPGYFPGGETGARGWVSVTGTGPGQSVLYQLVQGSAIIAFQNPAWDYRSFDLDRDIKVFDDTISDAADPDLKAFRARGGKLILFQGWSDVLVAPTSTVGYYESVATKMGAKGAERFTRLYMAPGMQHCYGGPGPNSFGGPITVALEKWVEHGSAPDRIIATKYKDDDPSRGVARTRPLCPYPQVARHRGSGSIDDAANFACVVPKPETEPYRASARLFIRSSWSAIRKLADSDNGCKTGLPPKWNGEAPECRPMA